jgi:hypothetical protein
MSTLRDRLLRLTLYQLAEDHHSDGLTAAECRLLAWIAYHVAGSEHADVGLLTRDYMFSDIGLSERTGHTALRGLIDKRRIEVVTDFAAADEWQIAIRLIIEGLNDHPSTSPPTVTAGKR